MLIYFSRRKDESWEKVSFAVDFPSGFYIKKYLHHHHLIAPPLINFIITIYSERSFWDSMNWSLRFILLYFFVWVFMLLMMEGVLDSRTKKWCQKLNFMLPYGLIKNLHFTFPLQVLDITNYSICRLDFRCWWRNKLGKLLEELLKA